MKSLLMLITPQTQQNGFRICLKDKNKFLWITLYLLMQSASSKKDLGGTKEEKPQILKFFYDDDDDIN